MKNINLSAMLLRDIPAVLDIESKSFEFPWCEEELFRTFGQSNCFGMVAECDGRVVGFVVYELMKKGLHILDIAVDPAARRHGVGTAMMDWLVRRLSYGHRDRIMVEVRETNRDAQLFFRSCGFLAISVLREFYDDSSEDAYLMTLRAQLAPQ